MTQVYTTVLQPAGFGQWQWTEGFPAEAAESYEAYEALCREAGQEPTLDPSLSGLIQREQGMVYRFGDGDSQHYEMVWIEDNE